MATKRRPHGAGSVHWDDNKQRWVAQLSVAGPNGKRTWRRRHVTTKRAAEQALAELRVAAALPPSVQHEAPTTGAWLEHWLSEVLPNLEITPKTKSLHHEMARHLLPLRPVVLPELRPEHVEALLAGMARKGLSRNTCRLSRQTLSLALGHAERRGIVQRNVAKLAVLPAAAPRAKERRILTPEQVKALEEVLVGEGDEGLWLAMALLGLRPGEAAALTWQDVDLEARVLHVVQARKWTPQGYEMGPPKTRRAVRALKMPERLVAALASMGRGEPEALVWPGKDGKLRDESAMRRRLGVLCRRAGLPRVTPYELRHTAASLLSDAGVPIEVLADLLGHTTTAMLEGVYRHRVRKVVDPGLW